MNMDNLESSLDQLGQSIAPGSSIVPSVMARVRVVPMQSVHTIHLRRWLMRVTIGLAACTAGALLFINFFTHPVAALADVLDKVQQTRTLTFDIGDQSERVGMHISIKGDLLRAEIADLQIVDIWNRSTGKILSLDAKNNRAIFMTFARQPFDFYTLLKDFKDGKEENLGEKGLNGQKCAVYKITRPMPEAHDMAKPTELTLWVDPSTDLPVQAMSTSDGHDIYFKNLKFGADIDDSLFDTTIPVGYKTQDLGGITSDQLKAAPTTQEVAELFTLTPNVGMGTLAFGDSREKVIQILGQPEQGLNQMDLGYPSKGIFLLVVPKAGIMRFVAMSKKSAGPFAMNDFAGKTDQGIAMGATRAQIQIAYGKPSNVTEHAPDTEMLEFKDLNTTFTLFGDQLVQISMQKPAK
jgi:hypothetical protein